ncbi:MAG: succinylglutamate desuccinylase/aspartoacylase family protein [Bacteroidota bacterium]
MFILAGLHGNEPAGVIAAERVFARIQDEQISLRGRFLALRGNRKALALGQRYIDRDLNRLWSSEEIARVKALDPASRNNEEGELLEILSILEPIQASAHQPQIYADLHTTSGKGGIFSIVTEDARIRALAEKLYAPVVFNLVDELALTTSRYFEEHRLMGLAFESGQHDEQTSIDNHEAAIWILLAEAGCIDPAEISDFGGFAERLHRATQHLDRYLKVTYRHPIEPVDAFVMEQGYQNFQEVSQGELLAADKDGKIRSPHDGQILMPLYQKQGEDGFFVMQSLDQPLF